MNARAAGCSAWRVLRSSDDCKLDEMDCFPPRRLVVTGLLRSVILFELLEESER